MRTKKLAPGATLGFPLAKDAVTARLAFGRLAEAAEQKETILNEVDDALRAAMLSAILVDITAAAAELMPLLANATGRAQRDARAAGRKEAEISMLAAGLDRTSDDLEAARR